MEGYLSLRNEFEIRWTEIAFQYLEATVEYVASESPRAAELLSKRIGAAVSQLAQHPEIGRPGRCSGTRELVISGTPYIIPYRIKHGKIEILRVLHGARKWPRIF